jgi:hypothetical protein
MASSAVSELQPQVSGPSVLMQMSALHNTSSHVNRYLVVSPSSSSAAPNDCFAVHSKVVIVIRTSLLLQQRDCVSNLPTTSVREIWLGWSHVDSTLVVSLCLVGPIVARIVPAVHLVRTTCTPTGSLVLSGVSIINVCLSRNESSALAIAESDLAPTNVLRAFSCCPLDRCRLEGLAKLTGDR